MSPRLLTALASTITLVVVVVVAVVVAGAGSSVPCRAWDVRSLDAEQRANAQIIVQAGSDLGLSPRDQAIGIMTALGESSLRNLEYGDWETSGVRNPDGTRTTSLGLFQQQDEWGTREQRLDPYTAATMFYRAMLEEVPDAERTSLEPTLVAHRTQINARADHYSRFWPTAIAVVEELTGTDTGLSTADGGC